VSEARQAMSQTLGIQAHWLEAQVYRALASPTRLDILYTLGDGPRTVTDLADTLGLPVSCISRHLHVLHETTLVNAHRLGSTILYSMSDPRIVQVIELLRLASAHPTRLASTSRSARM